MKALIVDDESRVRKAIRLLVHWEEHGIEQIDEATNGLEAMDIIRRERPQIVLLDILMPLSTGVDLMGWLYDYNPNIKFIVISGHDDFEYVRNTVLYRGIDYILKPIDEKIINAAISKAMFTWRKEEQERLAQLQKNVQVNEYRPFYTEKHLTSLIEDEGAQNHTVRRLQAEGSLPPDLDKVRLALLQIDRTDKTLQQRFGNDMDIIIFSILNICNEYLQEVDRGLAFRHWGTQSDIVLLVWKDFANLPILLKRINEGMFRTLNRNMHFGLSPTGSFPSEMPQLYAAGLAAIRSRNLFVLNAFIHEDKYQSEKQESVPLVLRFADYESHWKLTALSGQQELIAGAVEDWILSMAKRGSVTPNELEQYNRDIERFQARLLQETAGNAVGDALSKLLQANATKEMPNPDKSILSLKEWQEYWKHCMLNLARILVSFKMTGQNLMGEITDYLENNYQKDLSLNDIANHFHVSREYVSRKFKQTFGVNLSEYLSHIRINNAKLLLLNPQLKIAPIAEMVGFKNEKYFSLVFKKQEGISPNEYRKKEG
ncbi:helix-turn-helix domain-containing protein [Cohnella sp. WQ 127256]|uniref:response regulator transcription factor n=1 Tax=Cohnella sp. WQ 127256 TaxID=2938790 RepID=UPI002117F403|nr:helix-turn-helix domain-containing protein [Cohnella sp. WQ 127256]